MTATDIGGRLAGAPISWGVCEAPGWGHELPPDRVLSEMCDLGLHGLELGPTGYLGGAPAEIWDRISHYGMRLVGGFLPVTLHVDPVLDLTPAAAAIATLAAAGSDVVVLAAESGGGGYDDKVTLSGAAWTTLVSNLARLQEVIAAHGMTATLHPHVGTVIEDRDAVLRLLDASDIKLCLDTGHLLLGGMQPLELVHRAADRVAHVHLKDVRTSVATSVASGATSYLEGVRAGLYTPLGEGDLDIAGVVSALEKVGYHGWYVLEQDCALTDPPAAGAGPMLDVGHSMAFLTSHNIK